MQKYDMIICPTEREEQAMRQAVNLVLNLTGMLIVIQIVLDFLRDRRELRIDRAEDS